MVILITLFCAITFASCSGSSKSQSPLEPNNKTNDFPLSFGTEDTSGRSVLAVYDAVIDPIAKTFTVTPAERIADYHFPLTQLYPNVLKIVGYGWTPNFWADIKLAHPFPGSGIKAYDPRVIAILPANPGVSFNYPVFNCIGNNSVVMEPDGYTKLFDNLGGSIPGNTNPFKAYFKDQPNRVWSSTGITFETQRWNMNLSGFEGPLQYKLIVDVSTNYPNSPQPVIDNAPEPVQIETTVGPGLTSNGGSALVEVTFLDWQGASDIKCKVETPALFNSAIQLPYSRPGPNPNEYIFSGTISNSLLAPPGEYDILIAAWDIPTDIHVFQEIKAQVVDEIIFDPVDVTPPWLNFSPNDVFIDGIYAYIAGGVNGLHIFNISDPINPFWVSWVDTDIASGVYVTGGLAYVVGYYRLQIIDIQPPESANIVNNVNIPGASSRCVYVTNGYAYVADLLSGLNIIDIEPPESANLVKTVDTPAQAFGVYVTDGYAYVADENSGLQIIDIDPPESASIVKTVDTPSWACNVYVIGGYAYVADWTSGLHIIDIEPLGSAHIIKTISTYSAAMDVYVTGGYAFVADNTSGFQIIDVEPPENAYIYKTIEATGIVGDIFITDDYAYVTDGGSGLQIIDIKPLETANIVNTIITPGSAYGIDVTDGYAYIASYHSGLHIIDIVPPESASVLKVVDTPGSAYGINLTGNYAYLSDGLEGLLIIDIEPLESSYIVKTVDTPGSAFGAYINGDYAYCADGTSGLQIIDIEPPQTASIVKTVDTPNHAYDVFVSGGYAYVADSTSGLQVIDIEPLENSSIVKTIDTSDASGIYLNGSYAYVADGITGLQIIDIEQPENAFIVKTIGTPGTANGIFATGGYAYVADGSSGLQIIDIDPPESASIVNNVDTPGSARGICVTDGYAYIADDPGGLRIIKLW